MSMIFSAIEPDPTSIILGTGFSQFESKKYGMDGLMKSQDGAIEILAIHSEIPNEGNFRRFCEALTNEFREVIFWVVMNPIVEQALARYGFIATQKYDPRERLPIPGMIWQRRT